MSYRSKQHNVTKVIKKRNFSLFPFILVILFLVFVAGCSMPSDGWFQRLENATNQELEVVRKIEVHAKSLADTIEDESIQEERRELLDAIPKPKDAPPDDSPFEDWTWIAILAGVSAFSPAVANKLQTMKTGSSRKS